MTWLWNMAPGTKPVRTGAGLGPGARNISDRVQTTYHHASSRPRPGAGPSVGQSPCARTGSRAWQESRPAVTRWPSAPPHHLGHAHKGDHFDSKVSDDNLGIVDAVVRTMKRKIRDYLHVNKTRKYINVPDRLVESYNKMPHRGIGDMTPLRWTPTSSCRHRLEFHRDAQRRDAEDSGGHNQARRHCARDQQEAELWQGDVTEFGRDVRGGEHVRESVLAEAQWLHVEVQQVAAQCARSRAGKCSARWWLVGMGGPTPQAVLQVRRHQGAEGAREEADQLAATQGLRG